MHDLIRSHFAAFQEKLVATTVADPRQRVVSEIIEKLPPLYTQYRETNSSRFGDEITRLVQVIIRELDACPEAKKLEAEFREGLHLLHEDLGIPKLAVKAPIVPKTRKPSKR